MERSIYSLTEKELEELLSLPGVNIKNDLILQNDKDSIDFLKETGYWSKSDFLGEKYVIFKNLFDGEELYIPIIREEISVEDRDTVIDPYHIGVGYITHPFLGFINPIEVIEWFLKKGFNVGNLILKE